MMASFKTLMTPNIKMYNSTIQFIRDLFKEQKEFIPLHAPVFIGNEKKYVLDTIESTYVSSVGQYVNRIEEDIARITNSPFAVATMNGTAALHICLLLAGVKPGDLVITQSLTFVATCNAINYCKADPVFLDVNPKTMGLCPKAVEKFLKDECDMNNNLCIHKKTKKVIRACVPMHTFGHPCEIDQIIEICKKYNIEIIEDAAESLGSLYKNKHTGTFANFSAISFNGNKIITGGSGGIILIKDSALAKHAKHITTTAKIPHRWEYVHDCTGYNYRLPNINSALLCAQLENLELFLTAKRKLANHYINFFSTNKEITFMKEPENAKSNYWLNTIKFQNKEQRDNFLDATNAAGIMTRPAWCLMHKLIMFKDAIHGDLSNSEHLENTLVNIPSSYIESL